MLTINHPAPAIQYPSPHAIDFLKAVKFMNDDKIKEK